MRVRLAISAIAALALLGVVSAPASAAPRDLRLKTHTTLVPLNKDARLTGGDRSGKSNEKILLKADRFPFKKFRKVDDTRTNAKGRFGFKVAPTLATKYKVVLDKDHSTSSDPIQVYVAPRIHQTCSLCGANAPSSAGSYTLVVKETLLFPSRSVAMDEVDHNKGFFYYGQRDGTGHPRKLRLKRTKAQRYIGKGRTRVKISYPVTIPASEYSLKLALCVPDAYHKLGIGLPGDHRCGRKSIPYDYGYLGRASTPRADAEARHHP